MSKTSPLGSGTSTVDEAITNPDAAITPTGPSLPTHEASKLNNVETGYGPAEVDASESEDHALNENEMTDRQLVSPKTSAMTRTARLQFFALFFAQMQVGWETSTAGPLIPRLQIFYNVNYTVVSIIFIVICAGFFIGATANVYLSEKIGFGKVLVLGSLGQIIAYILMIPAPPFPVFYTAFLFIGWSISIQVAQSNSYVAGLSENSSKKMGFMHAGFGLGAVCSPLAATQFAKMPRRWSFHYIISLGIAMVNTLLLVFVFKGKTQDECLCECGEAPMKHATSKESKYKQFLRLKVVHVLAFFSLVYVGIEFTIGWWTVSYMQKDRGGGPSSGYVSTGFFGGLTLGRVCLLWVNEKVGEHLVVYAYILLSLGLELVVWLVRNLVADAVAISFVGFFLGPMYPIMMNETGRLVPQWLLNGSIGWVASFGYAGSALFPFITGALAQRFGIGSLQPLLVILYGVSFALWLLVPGGNKRAMSPGDDVKEMGSCTSHLDHQNGTIGT